MSELCGVKPHVLRYWEQEFPQLKPVKRRGQPALLPAPGCARHPADPLASHEQGFTIGGARNRLGAAMRRATISRRRSKSFGKSESKLEEVAADFETLIHSLAPRSSWRVARPFWPDSDSPRDPLLIACGSSASAPEPTFPSLNCQLDAVGVRVRGLAATRPCSRQQWPPFGLTNVPR